MQGATEGGQKTAEEKQNRETTAGKKNGGRTSTVRNTPTRTLSTTVSTPLKDHNINVYLRAHRRQSRDIPLPTTTSRAQSQPTCYTHVHRGKRGKILLPASPGVIVYPRH